jgi:hypothetical protein
MGHGFSSLMDPILILQRIKNYVLSTTWPDGSISFHAYNNCLEHQGKKHRFILEYRLASAKQQDVFGCASILKREGKALAYFLFSIRFGIETNNTR